MQINRPTGVSVADAADENKKSREKAHTSQDAAKERPRQSSLDGLARRSASRSGRDGAIQDALDHLEGRFSPEEKIRRVIAKARGDQDETIAARAARKADIEGRRFRAPPPVQVENPTSQLVQNPSIAPAGAPQLSPLNLPETGMPELISRIEDLSKADFGRRSWSDASTKSSDLATPESTAELDTRSVDSLGSKSENVSTPRAEEPAFSLFSVDPVR